MHEGHVSAGVVAAGVLLAVLAPGWTISVTGDGAVCAVAGVLLGQGLVRDLRVIRARRRSPMDPAEKAARALAAEARGGARYNLCLESTLGLLLLALALVLVLLPDGALGRLPAGWGLAAAGVVMTFGWATRDVVLTLRRVEDHYDLPVYQPATRAGEQPPAPPAAAPQDPAARSEDRTPQAHAPGAEG